MQNAHFIQSLYKKYYSEKNSKNKILGNFPKSNLIKNSSDWNKLTKEEKENLAEKYLAEGEMLLAKKDTTAIEYFNAAAELNPNSSTLWFRQGKSLLSYGMIKKQEKSLFLACKNFKMAAYLDENSRDILWHWAYALQQLGNKTQDSNYLHTAKEKYQNTIELTSADDKRSLFKLYWELAKNYMDIAALSEEAGDVRQAIKAFRLSFAHQTEITANFWCDFGSAYLQMGLFINDNRLYHEAIDYFEKALHLENDHFAALSFLAHSYTELYINTLNNTYFNKASEIYQRYIQINNHDSEMLLCWAQLLCEYGKINKDIKKLELSVDKCVEANKFDKKNLQIIAQWVESLALQGAYSNRLDLIAEAEDKISSATERNHKVSELWYAYGICLRAYGKYYNDIDYEEMAIEKFQIGLAIDNACPELLHAIAYSYGKVGTYEEDIDLLVKASNYYLKAIDLKPSSPSLTFDYSKTLLSLGQIKEDHSLLIKALYYIEKTLNNKQDAIMQHPDLLFTYGRILDVLGDCHDEENTYFQKALQAFQNVLLIDPDYPKLHFHIGLCYQHLGDFTMDPSCYKKAINSFNLALRQNIEDDLVYLEWGIALISLGDTESEYSEKKKLYFEEAESKIIKAGQLGNQHAYYYLACLYSILKRYDECIIFLTKSDKEDVLPSTDEILEDEWLENVRHTPMFKQFIQVIESKKNMIDGN